MLVNIFTRCSDNGIAEITYLTLHHGRLIVIDTVVAKKMPSVCVHAVNIHSDGDVKFECIRVMYNACILSLAQIVSDVI